MFEKISKGLIAIDDSSSNGVVDSGDAFNVAQVNREDGEEYDICAVWKDAHFHEPERPKQNADFICFCFNLQQKYDIGLFEETINLLSTLTEKFDYKNQSIYSFAMNDIDKVKSLLTKLKQNK